MSVMEPRERTAPSLVVQAASEKNNAIRWNSRIAYIKKILKRIFGINAMMFND